MNSRGQEPIGIDVLHMPSARSKSQIQVVEKERSLPVVSIILPTNTRYPNVEADKLRLKALVEIVEQKLSVEYSAATTKIIIDRLNDIYRKLDFAHLSEGLAIYISPKREKVIHLPFTVQEKLVIDNSFEVRDLLYASRNSAGYLLLLLGVGKIKMYYGFNRNLEELSQPARPVISKTELNGLNREEYFFEIDAQLTETLKRVNAPVIVCGPEPLIGHFCKATGHKSAIVGLVEGNFDYSSTREILEKISPALKLKFATEQDRALRLLDQAIENKTYVSGISNVWRAAAEKNGKLLIVEKDYFIAAKLGKDQFTLITDIDENAMYVIKDAVEDVIELVLRQGGDVVFIENGMLKEHSGIALITRD